MEKVDSFPSLSAKKREESQSRPVFSFLHLRDVSYKKARDAKFFCDFIERLQKLSLLGWKQIEIEKRHGYGFEKMAVSSMKHELPPSITEDLEALYIFRATGKNHSFAGYRREDTFYIIFIEAQFGDIYDHGKSK